MSNDKPSVGFVGVGLMGHGLAKNAQAGGHSIRVLLRTDADRERAADLLANGAAGCASPSEVSESADVVIICITGSPQVEEAVLGEQGILKSLKPGTIVVDCSTAIPESTKRVAAAVQAQGGFFIDAAMTGTPKEAEEGEINLLVGGDQQVLERVRPVLASFAKNIYYCGAVGAGHAIKLLHQFVVLSNAAVLAEAFSFAKKAEVDMKVLCDVIDSGGANSTAFQRFRPYVLDGNDERFRFSLANALKDLQYYTQMTEEGAAVDGMAQAALQTYLLARDENLRDEFVPNLIPVLDKLNKSGA